MKRISGRERRRATTSFQTPAPAIVAKLQALQQARDASRCHPSGRDLVIVKASIVEDELEKLRLSRGKRKLGGSRMMLRDAYKAGEQAGMRFEPATGISHAA